MPSDLKTELDRLGYDWDHGTMVLQEGNTRQGLKVARIVGKGDPVLHTRFQNGSAVVDVPRFMASDKRGIYIVTRDQQRSGLQFIRTNPKEYVTNSESLPYPAE